jgi:predicted oxidoreductase
LTWGTGKALVDAVWGAIQQHPRRSALDVRLRTKVVEVLREGERVTGVRVEDGGAIPADTVVIAAGGVGGNLDIVRREWPPELGEAPKQILMGSHYYADGALHEEVERLGGNVTHLSNMWNYADAVRHPEPRRPLHGLKLIPPRSGLMLKPTGERFFPPIMPTFDNYYALERMCNETEQHYAWIVCNRKIARRELDVSGAQHNPSIRNRNLFRFLTGILFGKPTLVRHFVERCPDFVSAPTLRELAAKMGEVTGDGALDAELMEREVRRYDDTLARGKSLWNDDQIRRIAQLRAWRGDRLRTCKFQQIADPKAGPLIAIRLQPMARKSLGGIQTDLECRVMGGDGPIEGLYAVGEAAGFGGGGLHGKRALEGTFLGGCVFTGRVAAKAIAG